MSKSAIQKCVDLAGGQTALVEKMKPHLSDALAPRLRQGHVWGWLNRDRMSPVPPAEYVTAMSKAVEERVSPYDLRPDIFPAPAHSQSAA